MLTSWSSPEVASQSAFVGFSQGSRDDERRLRLKGDRRDLHVAEENRIRIEGLGRARTVRQPARLGRYGSR